MRLDKYISGNRKCTRNRAQFFIDQGLVLVNEVLAKKASHDIAPQDTVRILEDKRVDFVSRSAIKLDTFLQTVDLDIRDTVCLDIGASTGGFTQILLGHGAGKVYAVDVGTSQLHPSLREDIRVVSIENTDIRDFRSPSYFDVIVGDISFISLVKLIDPILLLADDKTEIILLYKPQFEVGRENLRKTGVPKSEVIVERKFREFQELLTTKGITIKKISLSSLE